MTKVGPKAAQRALRNPKWPNGQKLPEAIQKKATKSTQEASRAPLTPRLMYLCILVLGLLPSATMERYVDFGGLKAQLDEIRRLIEFPLRCVGVDGTPLIFGQCSGGVASPPHSCAARPSPHGRLKNASPPPSQHSTCWKPHIFSSLPVSTVFLWTPNPNPSFNY